MIASATHGRAVALDAGLVARARRGDWEAFAALIRQHDHGLRALAFRLLGDRERMDDALQEAYLRALRGLPGFRGDSAFGTWLYRIAYNACLDELKRSRRAEVVPLHEVPERRDARPDPLETAARRDELARALDALPSPDRATVLLVDAQGFDYGSAAEILGVPEGTIASRLNRARASLRRALEGAEAT
jgi:RNA polymerase sigma-70 factor, ECF subfamily